MDSQVLSLLLDSHPGLGPERPGSCQHIPTDAGSTGETWQRERFLERMEVLVRWECLLEEIRPYYPKAGRGRAPYELESMLRVHCVQRDLHTCFNYGLGWTLSEFSFQPRCV